MAKAVFGTARTVFETARPDALKSSDSLRPAPAKLEEPDDLEESARPDAFRSRGSLRLASANVEKPTIWRRTRRAERGK